MFLKQPRLKLITVFIDLAVSAGVMERRLKRSGTCCLAPTQEEPLTPNPFTPHLTGQSTVFLVGVRQTRLTTLKINARERKPSSLLHDEQRPRWSGYSTSPPVRLTYIGQSLSSLGTL